MKPINSREKSKQLWQFVFIVFGLAVVPAALIFFSYYKVPEELSRSEEQKLVDYGRMEHAQRIVIRKMIEIDSNINRYANAQSGKDDIIGTKITNGYEDLRKMDSSKIVQVVSDGYEHHYSDVKKLAEAIESANAARLKLEECNQSLKAAQSNSAQMGAMSMPPQPQ